MKREAFIDFQTMSKRFLLAALDTCIGQTFSMWGEALGKCIVLLS